MGKTNALTLAWVDVGFHSLLWKEASFIQLIALISRLDSSCYMLVPSGCVNVKKIKFDAKNEYEFIENFKVKSAMDWNQWWNRCSCCAGMKSEADNSYAWLLLMLSNSWTHYSIRWSSFTNETTFPNRTPDHSQAQLHVVLHRTQLPHFHAFSFRLLALASSIQGQGCRQECASWQAGQRSLPGQLWVRSVVQEGKLNEGRYGLVSGAVDNRQLI